VFSLLILFVFPRVPRVPRGSISGGDGRVVSNFLTLETEKIR
jgi:hypothetical protein